MRDFSKTSSSGKPAVRQIKGPGMNRGLKKRHKPAKPEPFVEPDKKRPKWALGKASGETGGGKRTGKKAGPSFLSKGLF